MAGGIKGRARWSRTGLWGLVVTLLALALAGCARGAAPLQAGSGGASPSSQTASAAASPSASSSASSSSSPQVLRVFAAASLGQVLPRIAREVFAPAHPEIEVSFSFDGSATLVEQIAAGAPADVLATADEKNMQRAAEQGLVGSAQLFTANSLVLIVPAGNPAGIKTVADLAGTKLVTCALGVPCGNATAKLEQALGVDFSPVSEEQSVSGVWAKVESGEADAGFVYATDARAAGEKVEVIDLPAAARAIINHYPVAVVKGSSQGVAGGEFVAAMQSPAGQEILAAAGFLARE